MKKETEEIEGSESGQCGWIGLLSSFTRDIGKVVRFVQGKTFTCYLLVKTGVPVTGKS